MNKLSPQTKFRQNYPEISQHYGLHCREISLCFAKPLSESSRTFLRNFSVQNFWSQATKCVLTFGWNFARCNFGIFARLKSNVFQGVLHTTGRERNIKMKSSCITTWVEILWTRKTLLPSKSHVKLLSGERESKCFCIVIFYVSYRHTSLQRLQLDSHLLQELYPVK